MGRHIHLLHTKGITGDAEVDLDEIYNKTVASLIQSGLLELIKIYDVKDSSDYVKQVDVERIERPALNISVPEKNQDAIYVGEGHNAALDLMIQPDVSLKTKSTELIESEVLQILYSNEMKSKFIELCNLLTEQIVSGGKAIVLAPDEKSGMIVGKYLELYDGYDVKIDKSVEVTNKYIEIIENSDELTEEQKQIVYNSLVVASYSTDFWTGFDL
ncbi:MAG: hypothetical protein K2H10_03055 [Bacteroidales bacterium]|nr:hypothetical protein [Bacteroidales bacterium]